MKVLFFFGGLPHYLIPLLNTLKKKGVDVNVIIPMGEGKTIGKHVKIGNEGINFNLIELEEYKTFYRKFFFKKVYSVIKSVKPDIIVLGWPYILSLFFYPGFLFFLKKNNMKIIFREIPFQVPPFNGTINYLKGNPIFNENLEKVELSRLSVWFMRWIRKYYYSQCDATLNYCEKAYDIQQTYGVKKEKIFISYNTPDTDALFRAKEMISGYPDILFKNPFRVIHVGRLVKWKKVDLLIRVIAELKQKFPAIELVVIGNGPEKENLVKLAKKLKVGDSILWIGEIYDYLTLGRYFMVSSVYVLAGFGGLSINEAMGFGKPVICSTADGTEKKLVRHKYNGLNFKDGDERSLREQLEYLFSQPEKIKIFGKNSEQIIKEEINLKSVSENYLTAFRYVLGK